MAKQQDTSSLIRVNKKRYNFAEGTDGLQQDSLVIEEPLQVELNYFDQQSNLRQQKVLNVLMRTPGDDFNLVKGFLFSEGLISSSDDIVDIELPSGEDNTIVVKLAENKAIDWPSLERYFASYSGCGVCGKSAIKSLALATEREIDNIGQWLSLQTIAELDELFRQHQPLHQQTGGVHAAAIKLADGKVLSGEDVGRHNAVDKVIGKWLTANMPELKQSILILSGRISFELMQKAVMAGVCCVVAVGAPSSLALKVAQQFDITLIGFAKTNQCNVYHGDWRLTC